MLASDRAKLEADVAAHSFVCGMSEGDNLKFLFDAESEHVIAVAHWKGS
jgi:hypothetical protein